MHKKKYISRILLCISFLLSFSQFASSSPSVLLSKKISISTQNEPINLVLKQIEQIAGIKFMYNSGIIVNKPPVTLSLKNTSIRKALQIILNDPEIVFYEVDNYIIISFRKDVPQETLFHRAIVESTTPTQEYWKAINDTLKILDTVKVFDTIVFHKLDTLHVYDTIHIKKTEQSVVIKDKDKIKEKKSLSINAEITPFAHSTLNNSNDITQFSYQAQILLEKNKKNLSFGVGLGYFAQKGASFLNTQTTRKDSTLHEDVKTEVHRFITGHYFYIDNKGDTIRVEIWDSVTVKIPYSWYSHETITTETENTFKYTVSWITFPFRFTYKTNSRKKIDAGISVTITPSIAVNHGGKYYSNDTIIEVKKNSVSAFNLFTSLSPSLYFNINRKTQFYVSPTIQSSILSTYTNEKYYSFGLGLTIGLSINIMK